MDFGVSYFATDCRSRSTGERVEAIKEIWTSDEAQYHGKHVDFDPIWSWPKPIQKPHPPVLSAATAPPSTSA